MFSRTQIIDLQAGESKRIIHRVANNIPTTYHLMLSVTDPAQKVHGDISIERALSAFFAKTKEHLALQEQMTLETSFWQDYYSVVITANSDMRLELKHEPSKLTFQLIAASLGIVLLASLLILLSIF